MVTILIGCGAAGAQEVTGTPGSPSATTTIDGRYLPNPPPAFGGEINLSAKDSKPYWPPHDRAAQGRTERPADHDRRCRLRRRRHVRRRHPDTGAGPGRADGAALHAVPLHGALLADAGGADYRTQPSFGRLRGDLRAGHRLSRLRLHHWRGQRHDRQHPEGERLCHFVVRQEPQHAVLPVQQRRARSTNGRPAWASTISTASWAARPTSGRRSSSATTPRSSRGSASPATT